MQLCTAPRCADSVGYGLHITGHTSSTLLPCKLLCSSKVDLEPATPMKGLALFNAVIRGLCLIPPPERLQQQLGSLCQASLHSHTARAELSFTLVGSLSLAQLHVIYTPSWQYLPRDKHGHLAAGTK